MNIAIIHDLPQCLQASMKMALESNHPATMAETHRVMDQFFDELAIVRKLFFTVNADGVSEKTAMWTTQESFNAMVAQLGSTFVDKVPAVPAWSVRYPSNWDERWNFKEATPPADVAPRPRQNYPYHTNGPIPWRTTRLSKTL